MGGFVDISRDVGIVIGTMIGAGVVLGFFYRRVIKPIHNILLTISEIVSRELQPNHGSSMLDRLTRVEAKLDSHIIEALEDTDKLEAHLKEISSDPKIR